MMCGCFPSEEGDGMRQALLYPRDCSMQLEHTETCREEEEADSCHIHLKQICRMANSLKNQLAKHSTDNLPNLLIHKKPLIIYIKFIAICIGPVFVMEQLFLFVFRIALSGNSVY